MGCSFSKPLHHNFFNVCKSFRSVPGLSLLVHIFSFPEIDHQPVVIRYDTALKIMGVILSCRPQDFAKAVDGS